MRDFSGWVQLLPTARAGAALCIKLCGSARQVQHHVPQGNGVACRVRGLKVLAKLQHAASAAKQPGEDVQTLATLTAAEGIRASMPPPPSSLVSGVRLIPGTEAFLGLGFHCFSVLDRNRTHILAYFSPRIKYSRVLSLIPGGRAGVFHRFASAVMFAGGEVSRQASHVCQNILK